MIDKFSRPTSATQVVEYGPRWARPSLLTMIVVMAVLGCSRSDPHRQTTYPTKGIIRFADQPIGGAFLVLHPRQPSSPELPQATAHVQPDGSFQISTYDFGDGAPSGEYVVTVEWHPLAQVNGDFVPGENVLPAKYGDPKKSDVVVQIAAGNNELPAIHLVR